MKKQFFLTVTFSLMLLGAIGLGQSLKAQVYVIKCPYEASTDCSIAIDLDGDGKTDDSVTIPKKSNKKPPSNI